MRSDYKPLGQYITQVDSRNRELRIDNLIGLSIQKKFIPSISNTVGTDMSTYRIINQNQFAYCPVTSRNGEKITIALYQEKETAIISQAYDIFEVVKPEELLPEYLMMWFRRPEFDRYARYMSHGSVREMFSWEEMCNTLLPVPSITRQREIVKEYNVIQDRIALNQQLIQKLEETAQAIYKHWFVDFEFPDENGKPYKSSGGEMVWNEELGKEIPEGWKVDDLQTIMQFKNGKSKPIKGGEYPVYGGNGIIAYVNKSNDENVIAIGRVGAYCGSLYRVNGKCWISDNAISAQSKICANMFSYYVLNALYLNERSEGTGQPLITQKLLSSIKTFIPDYYVIFKFESIALTLFNKSEIISHEIVLQKRTKELLLFKLSITRIPID